MKKFLIYALVDPRDSKPKYIGRSSNGLSRPRFHLQKGVFRKNNTKVYTWIKSLSELNLKPEILVLEEWEFLDNDSLNLAEIKWIKHYKDQNLELKNMTNGGDGRLGTPLTENHRAAIRKSNSERIISEETRLRMKIAAKTKGHKPKYVIQLSDGRVFEGYDSISKALGCCKAVVCTMVKYGMRFRGIGASRLK